MIRKFFLLLVCMILSGGYYLSFGQNFPLPPDFKFDGRSDVHKYAKYIVPCVDWLQQTPLNHNRAERDKANTFVMNWLQINPDLTISLPEYSYKFHDIDQQLLYLFMEGWIKYTLVTGDKGITNCSIAGVHSMLDYYESGKASELGKNDFLDNLWKIERAGKLPDLFDTGHAAHNTYLYLQTSSARQEYKYNENYFSFNFYCINLVRPRSITYRYMLNGYYEQWINTKDGSVTYPRLPPGKYKFKVQASMYPNFDNATEVSWYFTINKPIWQENWFIITAAFLFLLVIYAIIKQRERNLKNVALLRHERIMFEHQHLKNQVNPHFLFNSLYALSILIEEKKENALSYTENLADLYRNMLSSGKKDLIPIREELDILANYTNIQQTRFGTALHIIIDIPEEIMESKKIVPLALQLLVENAIKHNVLSIADPLTIHIAATGDEIIIRNRIQPKISKEKGEGIGLVNIKKRYSLLTKKPVTYGVFENEYLVKLPLL